MRKSYSTQLRLDSPPIDQVGLNFECRDAIVPVLRSLQHVYSKPDMPEKIMQLIGRDINGKTIAKSPGSHAACPRAVRHTDSAERDHRRRLWAQHAAGVHRAKQVAHDAILRTRTSYMLREPLANRRFQRYSYHQKVARIAYSSHAVAKIEIGVKLWQASRSPVLTAFQNA